MNSTIPLPLDIVTHIIGYAHIDIDCLLTLEKELGRSIPRKNVCVDTTIRTHLDKLHKRRAKRYKDVICNPTWYYLEAFISHISPSTSFGYRVYENNKHIIFVISTFEYDIRVNGWNEKNITEFGY